ncbi:MAG: RNA polymerase sigma factor RpoH [Gammaproteobacteria bacterium]|nr:RNA polymerase sigma factor RpoH [Gammaproteobacteria bacterium]
MTVALDTLLVPTGSLESYVAAVNKVPMLSEADEQALARRFQADQDLDAARQLVLSHLRFVVRVARGYNGYGLAQADLIQEGNIGLMKAVKRFNPELGVRLVSFAVHWIKAEIHEFILRNWRIVKVATTKAQRKLFFNLRSARQRLGWMSSQEVEAVAKDLGVETHEVLLMEERMNAHDQAFDPAVEGEDDDDDLSPSAYLCDTRFEPVQQLERLEEESRGQENLGDALAALDARSRDIVTSRWLTEPKMTLQELADRYQVSAERIRQLENNAMKAMRRALGVNLLPAPAQA